MKKIALAATLAAQIFALACNSEGPCKRAYSKVSEQRACMRGADEIAPAAKGDIKAADAKCAEIYARTENSYDNSEGCFVIKDPDRDVRDLYNACHFGATGYMVAVEGQDAGRVQATGCEMVEGPAGSRCY
jgi:hypothetical protein